MLEEALENQCIPKEIFATSKWIEKNLTLFGSFSKDLRFQLVTSSVLEASLTTVSPDGVASLVPISSLPKPKKKPTFILALDRLQDPGNVGTLFRTSLAAEIDILWLALGADPLGQKVLRASAGAVLKLPFQRWNSSEKDAIDQLVENLRIAVINGYQVVGTFSSFCSNKNEIVPYWELDWIKPTILVLGNEGSGLDPRIDACCTDRVTLPHSEAVESLNVASAAVPLLLERRRAKLTS